MDKPPAPHNDVNRIIWNMYHPRRVSRKMQILLCVVGVGILVTVYGFYNLMAAVSGLFLAAIFVVFGYAVGLDHGKYEGEAAERKRMLDEGYALGSEDLPERDEEVTPLRTCKWCGHIIDEEP